MHPAPQKSSGSLLSKMREGLAALPRIAKETFFLPATLARRGGTVVKETVTTTARGVVGGVSRIAVIALVIVFAFLLLFSVAKQKIGEAV